MVYRNKKSSTPAPSLSPTTTAGGRTIGSSYKGPFRSTFNHFSQPSLNMGTTTVTGRIIQKTPQSTRIITTTSDSTAGSPPPSLSESVRGRGGKLFSGRRRATNGTSVASRMMTGVESTSTATGDRKTKDKFSSFRTASKSGSRSRRLNQAANDSNGAANKRSSGRRSAPGKFGSFGKKKPLNKESLDMDLDMYMLDDKEAGTAMLDKEIDAYMKDIAAADEAIKITL